MLSLAFNSVLITWMLFKNIFFPLFRLSPDQLSCFLDMNLQNVYHALQVFVQWIEDGYYDFRSLPYATKSHLSEDDEQKLQHLVVQAHYGIHTLITHIYTL